MQDFYIKTKIISGDNALSRLSEFKSKTICMVCDKFLSENGSLKKLLLLLDESNTLDIFTDIMPDAPIEYIIKGVTLIGVTKPDIVVAFGGGSAIDTAKAIIHVARKMGIIDQKLKLIAIPTTSGTGSEVTAVTVISDPKTQTKQVIHDPEILPNEAILDSELTLSVNPAVTANTGMDVLAHALESYVSVNASVYTDAFAEKSAELVKESLYECYLNGHDHKARLSMHHASNLAGIAFNKSGLGLCHAISHAIGGRFHIPHGLANTMLLGQIILFNSKDTFVKSKYAAISRKMGVSDGNFSDTAAVSALVDFINDLREQMNMPKSLKEFGIKKEDFEQGKNSIPEPALKDMTIKTNPRKAANADIIMILNNISGF